MAKKSSKPLTSQALVEILRSEAQRWVSLPNVTSVGVGYKVKEGVKTHQLCIQVTVSRKLTPAQLKGEGLESLPKFIKGPEGRRIPVDILERNYQLSFQLVNALQGSTFTLTQFADPRMTRRSRLTRIMPGISIGHAAGLAGTLGAVVYDNRTGVPCVLSNAHVLLPPMGQSSDMVVQPGQTDDAAVGANELGRVLREHIGLAGDCAVAFIQQRLFDEAVLELGVTPRRVAKVDVDDTVIKSGRTSGVTRGKVVRIGIVFSHDYGPPHGVRDIGCFEIGPDPGLPALPDGLLSKGGDSGSLWLIRQNQQATDIAVGLHFAEQTDVLTHETHALACNIHSVLEKLDVSFAPKV